MTKNYQDFEPTSRRSVPASPRDAISETWALMLTAVGVAAGIAQLVASGPGRVVLGLISGTALVFLAGRLSVPLRARTLAEQLQQKDAEIAKYRTTLRRVANPAQLTTLNEELLLVVEIGASQERDRVFEYHKTTAEPSLLYRVVKPITAVGSEPTTYRQLNLTAESLTDGMHLSVLPLSEDTAGVWLMVLLRPQLAGRCEWTLTYGSPVWDPLRSTGLDTLRWNPNLTRHSKYPARLTSFEVRFVFPHCAANTTVREIGMDRGHTRHEDLPNRQHCVVWRDDAPEVGPYEWELSAPFQ